MFFYDVGKALEALASYSYLGHTGYSAHTCTATLLQEKKVIAIIISASKTVLANFFGT